MLAVARVLVQFRIGVHGHAIGGRDEIVARIVMETGSMAHDGGVSLDTRNSRKHVSGEGEIRRTLLQLHVADPLADRDQGHLIRIDTKLPVRPEFSGRIVGLIALGGRFSQSKEP